MNSRVPAFLVCVRVCVQQKEREKEKKRERMPGNIFSVTYRLIKTVFYVVPTLRLE